MEIGEFRWVNFNNIRRLQLFSLDHKKEYKILEMITYYYISLCGLVCKELIYLLDFFINLPPIAAGGDIGNISILPEVELMVFKSYKGFDFFVLSLSKVLENFLIYWTMSYWYI